MKRGRSIRGCLLLLAAVTLCGAAARADEALASNPAAIIPGAAAAAGGQQPMGTIEGKNLIGRDLTSARDQLIGEIESVYVDGKGNVKQVIVTGMGDRTVAIDWKDVVVSDNGKKVAVNASSDQLKNKPDYKYAKPEQQGTVFTDEQSSAAPAP
ncbi:PRC-barrel domain-containing protein [Emcibacter sp. SYSU 3D8]|uniref:PRC-barrel domain-containing protein n=1 Tax=Emcibacter sp. SYSU 3D8 TaxID=3133969 RepID=UPI0031FED2B5